MAGEYAAWARIFAPSAQSDSFSISVDGVGAPTFSLEGNSTNQWSSEWQWVLISTLHVAPGTHILTLGGVESGVAISRVLITSRSDLSVSDQDILYGANTAKNLNSPLYLLTIRSGWSMIANPLMTAASGVSTLLPTPAAGSQFLKFDPNTGGYATNDFDGQTWTDPAMQLVPGEGGLFLNKGDSFVWGVSGDLPAPAAPDLQVGLNLLALRPAEAGLLTALVGGFQFKAGDEVYRIDSDSGAFTTYVYDGTAWDANPTINIGESVFVRVSP